MSYLALGKADLSSPSPLPCPIQNGDSVHVPLRQRGRNLTAGPLRLLQAVPEVWRVGVGQRLRAAAGYIHADHLGESAGDYQGGRVPSLSFQVS